VGMTDTLAERVERGAALLDERRPGWWDEVDVGRLDIDHCQLCVLGQLWGEYDDGRNEMLTNQRDAVLHGFDTTDRWAGSTLTNLWRAAIERRRSQVSA
jgi:hypothetical protein